MKCEPSRLEIIMTKLAFFFYGKSVYKTFADRLPLCGNERVLDFGCGMGTVAYYVIKRLPHGNLTCLDISEKWLNCCRKTLRDFKNVDFLYASAPNLPQDNFDLIYCHFVLHDISESDLIAVIPALVKSLRTGGTLIFKGPLDDAKKLNIVKKLVEQNGLNLKCSRITDVSLMGNAIENTYIK